MQTSSGEHPQQQQKVPFFLNPQCDPNYLMYAHHAILGYQNNMLPQAFPASQLPSLMLPQTAILPAMPHAMTPRNLIPSLTAAIPDMDKLLLEEPIEAGSMPYRRSNNKSTSAANSDDSFNNLQRSTSSSHFRRHSLQWETMTDDERELIQRQKRKEEAFKTALCDAYKRSGLCPYGESCRFAHGENELRMPSQPRGKAHPKYKTQLCDKFSTYGQCPYGPRCQFIHKLKKGLPLFEYNRALFQGQISPARSDEITNPDESQCEDLSGINLTRNFRRRSSGVLDTSDSGYSAGSRRRLHQQHHNYDQYDEQPQRGKKAVYPPMQVVNIEMATGQRKSSSSSDIQNAHRRQLINQADYEASMASGKIYGRPENIRSFGAMIRANEEHVERSQQGVGKKERVKVPVKEDLSVIREEDTLLVDGSQMNSTNGVPPTSSSATATTSSSKAEDQPWYEKIFGTQMTVIREESVGDEDDDSRLLAHDD